MQQMHMSHQQYDMAQQQAHQDQQQHYDPHVGHKREAEDADCESLSSIWKPLTTGLICHDLHYVSSRSNASVRTPHGLVVALDLTAFT